MFNLLVKTNFLQHLLRDPSGRREAEGDEKPVAEGEDVPQDKEADSG